MNPPRSLDGKIIRSFLFARMSRFSPHPVLVQVEGFDKDHAWKRLETLCPLVPKKEWEFIEELDETHTVGLAGKTYPLDVLVVASPKYLQ